MTRTVGNLVDEFIAIYGLKRTTIDPKHDTVHAMTGFGVGEVNEQRINAVIDGLENTRPLPEEEFDPIFADILAEAADEYVREYGDPQPKFANDIFLAAQKHAQPLDPRELEAYFQLGRKIDAAITAVTGHGFADISTKALSAVAFEKLDFSAEAFSIRAQFETAHNRRVENVSRNTLETESMRQTGQNAIPAANKPWTLK